MDLMFEAYLTHESTSQPEFDDIPQTNEPVWILGIKYNAMTELDEIRRDIRSRLWFTYRKGFIPIGDSGITTDKGWGCMLRCGQMVLAQAMLFLHLGREWRWTSSTRDKTYLNILGMFEDKRSAPYSIHQIAITGESEVKKQVGEWFGPNTVAQVLRKLVPFDKLMELMNSSIVLHVAMDNLLVTNEIKQLCRQPVAHLNLARKLTDQQCAAFKSSISSDWKPLILLIPLRLGINEINPIYVDALKVCFTFQQSLGMIGGKPNHALYFIGTVGNDVIFLDPHTTQSVGFINDKETEVERKMDSTYHTHYANRLNILQMDPSVAIAFLCRNESEFDALCSLIKQNVLSSNKQPLFEICEDRTENYYLDCQLTNGFALTPADDHHSEKLLRCSATKNAALKQSSLAQQYDLVNLSDDDFEFL